jgi:hypothetical protein
MDEIDEQFLVQSITEKATAHGKRHDSVMYLNHRVKKKYFLRIVNFSRKGRDLPPIKSATTAYNRSRQFWHFNTFLQGSKKQYHKITK